MRVLAVFIALGFSVRAIAANDAHVIIQQSAAKPRAAASDPRCSPTRSYIARSGGTYSGSKLAPKKLTELPPAQGYMAVFRHIGGCEAPLTVIEYRQGNRR